MELSAKSPDRHVTTIERQLQNRRKVFFQILLIFLRAFSSRILLTGCELLSVGKAVRSTNKRWTVTECMAVVPACERTLNRSRVVTRNIGLKPLLSCQSRYYFPCGQPLRCYQLVTLTIFPVWPASKLLQSCYLKTRNTACVWIALKLQLNYAHTVARVLAALRHYRVTTRHCPRVDSP